MTLTNASLAYHVTENAWLHASWSDKHRPIRLIGERAKKAAPATNAPNAKTRTQRS